jgi:phosphopentomutase
LYAYTGINKSVHTKTNIDGMSALLNEMDQTKSGFIMANLVDFDMLWGHRNDPKGFYEGLIEFDQWLPEFIDKLEENDLLIITADHGNDPAYKGTDHTREYIPLLVYGKHVKAGVNMGTRKSFADIGATVADLLNIKGTPVGESFKNLIIK